ncbi:centromere protein H (CENP-H)-domain-containing protein [Podospora didyma]|uniref:Centromere protein H (CENP-H)-domain-containing protein n=1 Tax=Podospora didyma TaxID=330526 RepID=A0AAE0P7B4_9PEZI|nr:centromere protein H (CENP-H)-domain-containing protein [Podospora didyma]
MASSEPSSLILPEAEEDVLGLYDKLQQLQLELALLRSENAHASDDNTRLAGEGMDIIQMRILDASAALALRNSVVENVMIAQPILRAVHNATHASKIERDILPCIQQRDLAATKAAKQCLDVQEASDRLAQLELQIIQTSHRNVELAAEVLHLADRAQTNEAQTLDEIHLQSDVTQLDTEMRISRQRWRVVKGTASAVVTGSGIDWARDKQLRDMVLEIPD